MSETPTTPAPELLSAERLAQLVALRADVRRKLAGYRTHHPDQASRILFQHLNYLRFDFILDEAHPLHSAYVAQAEQIRLLTMRADSAEWAVAEMRDELAAAEARAAEAEAQVAMLKTELAEREGRADCHCSARSENECTCHA